MKVLLVPLALIASLLLSACSVLPSTTPLRTFSLSDAVLEKSTGAALALTLKIETPSATAPLDGVRILVQPDARELQVYAGARWRDRAPVLLQERLISALRQDGRLSAIIDENSRARDDAQLSSQLLSFHSRYGQRGPEVVIELDAQLIDTRLASVLATRRFSLTEPASGENIEAIVAAFGKATDRLDRQVVEWILAQLDEPEGQ